VLQLGTVWSEDLLDGNPTWRTERYCLGEAQYAPPDSAGAGAAVPFSLRRSDVGAGACEYTTVDLDRFEILPAQPGECPEPGTVLNGDAETNVGWAFSTSGAAAAGFAAGVGENNSRAVRLQVPQRCDYAGALVPMSVGLPTANASAALSFFASAKSGVLSSRAGNYTPPEIASGAPRIHHACMPAPARGTTMLFRISASSGTGGPCTDIVNAESIIDSVTIANDPSCGADPWIADPGFESGYDLLDAYQSGTAGVVSTVRDPTLARTGMGALRLSVGNCNSQAALGLSVITPTTPGGASVAFWYRTTGGSNTQLAVYAAGQSTLPPKDTQWRQGRACLDKRLAGRQQYASLYLEPANGCTGTFADAVFVDDLVVGPDPTCAGGP
jgi:hypothetical protein